MKNKEIVGYYWDGKNQYIIYKDDNGYTEMVLESNK
jgi:hypothetical protein